MSLYPPPALERRALSRWRVLPLLWLLLATAANAAGRTDIKDHLYGVAASGEQVWAAGAAGAIYHSTDGGDSWTPQKTPTTENLFSIAFADAKTGWAVGRLGTILATTDGGATWTAQKAPRDRHLFDVAALGGGRAVAIGDWGTVIITSDGGATWQDHSLEDDVILNDQAWPDPQHGWLVGEAGFLFASEDGGLHWTKVESGIEKSLYGVSFRNLQEGFAVGIDGLVLSTSDGGRSWLPVHGEAEIGGLEQVGSHAGVENPHLYAIGFAGDRGYAVGENTGVLESSDGGRTWKIVQAPAGTDLRWLRALAVDGNERQQAYFVGAHGLVLAVRGDRIAIVSE